MLNNTLHTITKDKNKSLIVPTRSEVPKESTSGQRSALHAASAACESDTQHAGKGEIRCF
jgi:hypothetical protein